MILTKVQNGRQTCFEIESGYTLKKVSENESQLRDCFYLRIQNDPNDYKLKLLVILSPIFIASFDNGDFKLQFLKKTIDNSKYPYGLYPNFFENFDKETYLREHKVEDKSRIGEDIWLNDDGTIDFFLNPLPQPYLISLIAMVDSLIEDEKNRKTLLTYFDKMRDDIVRNGRRSILANGIQAFYLNKYVVVWMLDFFDFIKENKADALSFLDPIMDLINELKTPANLK